MPGVPGGLDLATPGWSDQEEDQMSVTSTKIHVVNEEAKPIGTQEEEAKTL